jgi:Fur family transcriptional regulator, iron response regulator
VREELKRADLRPTRQRLSLLWLLRNRGHRHLTAEMLYEEACQNRTGISLATVYNTLNQFADVGLVRPLSVDASKTFFDTDTSDHHHYYVEGENLLMDMPESAVEWPKTAPVPQGFAFERVDVIVRVKRQ